MTSSFLLTRKFIIDQDNFCNASVERPFGLQACNNNILPCPFCCVINKYFICSQSIYTWKN